MVSEEKAQINKLRFITKYRKQFLKLAENTTPRSKLDFIDEDKNFKRNFIRYYPHYNNSLKISLQREALMENIQIKIDDFELEKASAEESICFLTDAQTEQRMSLEKFIKSKEIEIKRYSKIWRKINRKFKYRLKESYFDNTLVNDWILLRNIIDNKKKTSAMMDIISRQILEIVKRQIKGKRFHQFGVPEEDLIQDLMFACMSASEKFDPSKGKKGRESFNYFSHICIKAGQMVTIKNSNRFKQEVADSDMVYDTLTGIENMNDDTVSMVGNRGRIPTIQIEKNDDALELFYNYFMELFNKKERMQLLLQILIHYVLNVNRFDFKKNKFVNYAKSHGFTSAYVNKFLNHMRIQKEKFKKDNMLDDLF